MTRQTKEWFMAAGIVWGYIVIWVIAGVSLKWLTGLPPGVVSFATVIAAVTVLILIVAVMAVREWLRE